MKLTVFIVLIPVGALAGALLGAYLGGSFGSTIGSLLGLIPGTMVSMVSAIRDQEQQQADQARIVELQHQTAELQHRTDPKTIWEEEVEWESRNVKDRVTTSSRYRGQR